MHGELAAGFFAISWTDIFPSNDLFRLPGLLPYQVSVLQAPTN